MRKKKNNSFWLSYSDLMTSLFFVMLVLFIAGIAKYGDANVEKQKLEQILKLDEQFKVLSNSSTLRYDEKKKTFIAQELEGKEIFEMEQTDIKPEYIATVDKVGRDLESLLKQLYEKNPKSNYLLIIEGTTANRQYGEGPRDQDDERNYELSFKRAHTLYKRWTKNLGINLRQYNTEIQLCGSGLNGINRDERNENNNKRFVIQIIPKIAKHDKD